MFNEWSPTKNRIHSPPGTHLFLPFFKKMEVDDPLKILEEQLEQESKKQDKRSRFKLLHDITIRFENDRRYRNDTRYIRIWLQYASYFRHAEWIYDYMFEQGIGEYVGAFYEQAAEYYTLYRNRYISLFLLFFYSVKQVIDTLFY